MTHPDSVLEDLAPPRRNRFLRLVILVLMTLCGLMIAAILLSDPRVSSGLQSAIGQVSDRFAKTGTQAQSTIPDHDTSAEIVPVPAVEPDAPVVKPPVSQLPASRIPVRRAGN